MHNATFTSRVDKDLKSTFSDAAKTVNLMGAQLQRNDVKPQDTTTDYDAWFRRQVQIGLDAANAGALIAHEDVEAEAAAWRAETLRKQQG